MSPKRPARAGLRRFRRTPSSRRPLSSRSEHPPALPHRLDPGGRHGGRRRALRAGPRRGGRGDHGAGRRAAPCRSRRQAAPRAGPGGAGRRAPASAPRAPNRYESLSQKVDRLSRSADPVDAFAAYQLVTACIWARDHEGWMAHHILPSDRELLPTTQQACGDIASDQIQSRLRWLERAALAGVHHAATEMLKEGPDGLGVSGSSDIDAPENAAWKQRVEAALDAGVHTCDPDSLESRVNSYESGLGVAAGPRQGADLLGRVHGMPPAAGRRAGRGAGQRRQRHATHGHHAQRRPDRQGGLRRPAARARRAAAARRPAERRRQASSASCSSTRACTALSSPAASTSAASCGSTGPNAQRLARVTRTPAARARASACLQPRAHRAVARARHHEARGAGGHRRVDQPAVGAGVVQHDLHARPRVGRGAAMRARPSASPSGQARNARSTPPSSRAIGPQSLPANAPSAACAPCAGPRARPRGAGEHDADAARARRARPPSRRRAGWPGRRATARWPGASPRSAPRAWPARARGAGSRRSPRACRCRG